MTKNDPGGMPARCPGRAATALAAAALLATQGAFAQSSVTLSSITDAAVRNVSNEGLGSVKSMVSSSNATSRLVVRGTEDLGGGFCKPASTSKAAWRSIPAAPSARASLTVARR
ncbi:MAG: porin [Rubrivivax sp.]